LYIFKNTRIHLDEVYGINELQHKLKKLGFFLELENVILNGKAKHEFDKIISLLNLNVEQQIRASYRDLITAK